MHFVEPHTNVKDICQNNPMQYVFNVSFSLHLKCLGRIVQMVQYVLQNDKYDKYLPKELKQKLLKVETRSVFAKEGCIACTLLNIT